MRNNYLTETLHEVEVLEKVNVEKCLILFNDDFNTFDHVIECLMIYCDHDIIQAEQCAHIVHNNGKCAVKNGTFEKLMPIKEVLQENGLTVSIK
ncbi:MAG: ATP-dependent Clp protease adaptor ClpS [Bacteroidia bacterium]|nr:ATP-dependent Clp protease adaptor ClpS [Bacteroidia bacterium]